MTRNLKAEFSYTANFPHKPSLYSQVVAQGIAHDHHESDLYIPVNAHTRVLLDDYEHRDIVTMFVSQIDGKFWYDVPFAYLPWWDAKAKGRTL
jgi:hypothetical protein